MEMKLERLARNKIRKNFELMNNCAKDKDWAGACHYQGVLEGMIKIYLVFLDSEYVSEQMILKDLEENRI